MVGPGNTDAFRRLAQEIIDQTLGAPGACAEAPDAGTWWTSRREIQDQAHAANEAIELPSGWLLVADLPGLCCHCVDGWLGKRAFVVSSNVIGRRRLSLVSSRLGERLSSRDLRIEAIRTGVLRADARDETLLTTKGTSCESFVRRAAELFGASLLEIVVADDDELPDDWWRSVLARIRTDGDANAIYVSPELMIANVAGQNAAAPDRSPGIPLRDRSLFVIAQRITVVHARPNGVTEELTKRHLSDSHRRMTPLLVVTPDAGICEDATTGGTRRWNVAQRLVDRGAIAWRLAADHFEKPEKPEPVPASGIHGVGATAFPVVGGTAKAPAVDDGPFVRPELWLSHWTRAIHGAWPDEDENAFVDHLLLGDVLRMRTQVLSLIRILQCGVLYGSARLVKGDQRLVSFTQRPLPEFRARRKWRRHLRRYDFETRGICVRRSVLEDLGAKPVVYVDEASQPDSHASAWAHPPGRHGEWAEEQEWRLAGDLNLANFEARDLCVFTDSPEEAVLVRCFSEFHVVVLP